MKKNLTNALLLIFAMAIFTQCKKNNTDEFETIQIAKIVSADQMRALSVGITKPTIAKTTGKIYLYNDFLFINEPNKGIHIYNNTNPSAPINLAFLQIPGNVDLSVRNNVLYADSYVDLLAFDISNINAIKQVKRVKDVFPQFYFSAQGNIKSVVIYKDTLINKATYRSQFDGIFYSNSSTSGSSSSGQGGSMARFTLLNDYLYTVGMSDLSLFDVKAASNPIFVKAINLGWGAETIFPYDNKLFIGTNRGMHIFSATDPANPVKLSTYSHIVACDPVVVQGKYAYVTLRTGNSCAQGMNQLEVVDIEDPTSPKQVAVYAMQNPHGLSVDGDNLFLCEGKFGLKSFNIADKSKIATNLVQHLNGINSFDVIAGPKSLIVTGDDGVYQFSYSNPAMLRRLSMIRINANTRFR